jgi:hypothetical protein
MTTTTPSIAALAAPPCANTTAPSVLPDILTPEDVATWLQVTVKWLYDHTTRSKPIVPHLRLGGHLRFRRAVVETWLDSQLRTSYA